MTWVKTAVFGMLAGLIHFMVTVAAFVYFGLGMDRRGAEFYTDVLVQPGLSIACVLAPGHPNGLVMYGSNFVLYGSVGALLYRLWLKIRSRARA